MLIATEQQHHKELILLVDDNKLLREVMAIMLKDEGYDVEEAQDGLGALELLRSIKQKPSCIILDLMMPVMNGEEFLTQLETKEDLPLSSIPVIIYSAEGMLGVHPQVVARLEKPISIELLFGAIKGVLN